MTEPLQRSPAVLYASHGRDAVHPNPLSHWLLGGAAANFVREQLRQHSQGARPSTTVIKQAPRARVFERCYEDASQLPRASKNDKDNATWRLVDEGAATGKGVVKLGLVSNVHGATLSLGPIEGPPGRRCSLMRLTVGFLLRKDKSQGDLHFRCRGCKCIKDLDFVNKYAPFPRWHTDAALAAIKHERTNLSVTSTAALLALWHNDTSCYLDITHMPRGGAGLKNAPATRVRVDSLVSEHRGVFGFVHKVLGHPRSYQTGVRNALMLLNSSRGGCPEDCTGGRWPCPPQPGSNVRNNKHAS